MFSVVTGGGAEQQPWRGQGAAPQQQYQPNQAGQNWLATARVGPRASTVKKLSMYRHNYTMVVKDTHKKKLRNNVNSRTIPNSKNDFFLICAQNEKTTKNAALIVPAPLPQKSIFVAGDPFSDLSSRSSILFVILIQMHHL